MCKLLSGITIEPSSDPTAAGGKENAKKYSKALSKAAKQAKGDIKANANDIVTNCVSENLPSGVTIPKIPGQ